MEETSSTTEEPKKKAKAKKIYTFDEARRIARSHGFKTQAEFLEYDCAGSYKVPKNVNQLYSNEWKGWDDFLGVPLRFEEGRVVARKLNIGNKDTYLKLKEEDSLHRDYDDLLLRLPYRPDLYYKEWISWENWLQE